MRAIISPGFATPLTLNRICFMLLLLVVVVAPDGLIPSSTDLLSPDHINVASCSPLPDSTKRRLGVVLVAAVIEDSVVVVDVLEDVVVIVDVFECV